VVATREAKPVVEAGRKAGRRRADVTDATGRGIPSGGAESIGQRARTMVRVGYGLRSTDCPITPIMPGRPDGRPVLPWEDGRDERARREARLERDRERDWARRREKAAKAEAVA
jgi:hypothetical protein